MKLRVCMIVAASMLVGAEDKKDASKADQDKLQGTWVAKSYEDNGEKAPEDVVKNIKITIKGDEWTLNRGDETLNGTMKFDATKKPKTFDSKVESSGDTVLGLYELDGNTWKICFTAPGGERPTEMNSKADSGRTMIVLKKMKK